MLIHHCFNTLAGALAHAAFVIQHPETVDFPTPLKRAMSLMVSRFCILLSCNVLFNYLSLTLPVHSAMGKVWFIVGLVASRYYIAIDATNIIGFSLLFAALFHLPEVIWNLIPRLSLDGD